MATITTPPRNQMLGVGLMTFILFLSTLVGVPVLPNLAQSLRAGPTTIPLIVSASLMTIVSTQFFTGALADHYSIRKLILISALLGAVTSLLCAVATHWTQLLVLRILGGLVDAIAMPALLVITASLGRDQPGKFFGILRSSQGLSYIIGPALGSLCSLVSLRMPFLVDGSLSLVAFLAAFFLLHDESHAEADHDLSIFRSLRGTFADARIYLYLLMGISGLFAFGILYSFVPTKAQLLGLDAWQIGVILGVGALIFSLGSYLTGILADRFGPRRFAIAAQLIIIISGLGLIISEGFAALLFFYSLFCIGETITFLLCFIYAAQLFERHQLGMAMGTFDALIDLSLIVGPLLAALMYALSNEIWPIFLLVIVPAGIAFPATIQWLKDDQIKYS